MTVKDYYKHFIGVYGAITALFGSLPILAFLPADASRYLFPPLGFLEVFSKVATAALVVVVTLLVYSAKDSSSTSRRKGRNKTLLLCSVIAFVGIVMFLATCLRFIRKVDVPSEQRSIIVSVGYDRTTFARGPELVMEDDWNLLAARGTTEQEIQRLWTFKSILVARLALWFFYLLFLLSLVAVGSFSVLHDKLGPAPNP